MSEVNDTIKAFTPIVGILCVSLVACEAFDHGLNGTIWVTTSTLIGLLAGLRGKDLVSRVKS